MNPINRRSFLAGVAVAGANTLLASPKGSDRNAEFRPLFDGTSLQGWFKPEFPEGHPYSGGRWQVADGSITGEQLSPENRMGSILLTEKSFGDFELTLDVLPTWGCDSGLFLRSTKEGQCIQVMIDYLPGGTVGFFHGQGIGGFLSSPIELQGKAGGGGIDVVQKYDAVAKDGLVYAADAATWRKAWRFEDWNTLRVRCSGRLPDITTWINDVKIAEMQSDTFHPRQQGQVRSQNWEAPSAYKAEDVLKRLGTKGHIGLQVHPGNRWTLGGKVRFRNLLLRELG